MLKILIIFSESLSMLMWLHIGFRKYIEQSSGKLLFCAFYVLYYCVISMYGTNALVDIIPVILILMWAKFQFKEEIASAAVKYIVSLIGVGVSQLLSVVLMYLLKSASFSFGTLGNYIGLSLISLILSIIIYYLQKNWKPQLPKIDVYTVGVLLFVVGIVLYIKYYYNNHKGLYGYLYVVLIVLLVVFVLVVLKGLKTKYELEQKRIELGMKETYDEVYTSLLLEMRRKQHDYKNQISALYSIQLVNDNKEELIKLQREYGEELLKSGKYDNLILRCSNPVLSGYVYTKCNEAERLGVSIEPSVMCTKSSYNISIHEIIEILGILINNAVEYLSNKEWEYKVVKVDFFEKTNKLHVEVSNVAEYISYEKIEVMFDMGYSTKGEGRGLGLYSLKNIVKKNMGELLVENVTDKNINWLRIRVVV